MNTKTRLSVGILALACLTAPFPAPLFAADPPARPAADPAALIQTLDEAYGTLSTADHDYHDHRALAMKEIADAAKVLGGDLTGNGRGGEPQKLSDLQLRSVQMSLVGVGREAPKGQPKHHDIVLHINAAIREITAAIDPESDASRHDTGDVQAVNAINSNTIEVSSLERIYEVLTQANHDYKGHRVKAMQAIQRACNVLGGHISGDGKAKEAQAASDADLHQSHKLLKQVLESFATNDPKSVTHDLTIAEDELRTALAIK